VIDLFPTHRFVLKTDVQAYYASIDHHLLLDQLAQYITDRRILNLIGQYLTRVAERGGLYWEHRCGIALGCPLIPLIGAFFLYKLDVALEKLGLFFCRYMDDILVLAPTRWKLRKAVTVVNQVLASLGLEKHPDKTFIGRIEKGFEFLGYHFGPEGLRVATKTLENFVARAYQLYEHERKEPTGSSTLGVYVQRWIRWVRGGIGGVPLALHSVHVGTYSPCHRIVDCEEFAARMLLAIWAVGSAHRASTVTLGSSGA